MSGEKSHRHAVAGRIGAHVSWANTADRTARTAPAVRAAMARFEKQVDPDGVLPPEERAKRAASARKAYFTRLALKSHAARRKTRAGFKCACCGRSGKHYARELIGSCYARHKRNGTLDQFARRDRGNTKAAEDQA